MNAYSLAVQWRCRSIKKATLLTVHTPNRCMFVRMSLTCIGSSVAFHIDCVYLLLEKEAMYQSNGNDVHEWKRCWVKCSQHVHMQDVAELRVSTRRGLHSDWIRRDVRQIEDDRTCCKQAPVHRRKRKSRLGFRVYCLKHVHVYSWTW